MSSGPTRRRRGKTDEVRIGRRLASPHSRSSDAGAPPFEWSCRRSGRCCTHGEGRVWLLPGEEEALARALGLPLERFRAEHVVQVGEGRSLKTPGGRCTLLAGSNDADGTAMLLTNMGVVLEKRGQKEEAVAIQLRAAVAARESGNALRLTDTLWNLARAQLAADRPREALAAAREAVGALSTVVGELGDEQGAKARSQFVQIFEIGVSAGLAAGDAEETAFFLESGRAGALAL